MDRFGARSTVQMMAPGELRIDRLSAGYNVPILHDVSFTLTAGQTLGLLGPSGGGKSTLLAAIAGLVRPTCGTVTIGEASMDDEPPHRRPLAMLFQDDGLYPHLSVAANLRLPLRQRCRRDEIAGRVASVADAAGITAWLDRYPESLSGGQRRRVALAKVFATPAAVRLLDEPLVGIDAAHRHRLVESMQQWDLDHHPTIRPTTIWVTHDGREAMRRADHIAVMVDGKIAQRGRPWEIYERPVSLEVAESIGSPPVNVMPQRLGGDGKTIYCRPANLKFGESAPSGASNRWSVRVVEARRVESDRWLQFEPTDAGNYATPPPRWWAIADGVTAAPPVGSVLWCWVGDGEVLTFPNRPDTLPRPMPCPDVPAKAPPPAD